LIFTTIAKYGGMMQLMTLTLLLGVVFVTPLVYGDIYYVAPGGSDANPGTEGQPWLTIQHAAETVVSGDTVYIKAGTYREHIELQNSGSPGHYIVYTAYPGDVVTIDGGGFDLPDWESGLFTVEEVSYIRISGLRIINAGPNDNNAGIYVDNTHHIIIENNTTYNTTSSGIGVWNSHNILIDGNEVELACNDGEQECITVAVTDTFEITNNHIHHGGPGTNGGEGIYIENPDCKHIVVRNNIFSQNVLYQIGHEIDLGAQDVIIDNNLIDGFRGDLDEEIYGSDYMEGDPKFMDISGSDFHLQGNSPAIDNGSSVDAPGEDFDGNPRPVGGKYDIGAYEYRDQTRVLQDTGKNRIPEKFRLSQNYPNPFNPETTIRFHVKESCRVMLRVYDLLGREVASLIDNHYHPGIYQLEFNSIGLASGIYIYKIRMGDFQAERRMVVLE